MKTVKLPKSRARLQPKGFAPRAVLVPVDFSPLSETAMERAKEIAQQFGSKLHVVHAVEPIIHPVEYAIVPMEMEEVNVQLVNERRTRLEALKSQLGGDGLDCRIDVRLGKPWHAIVDYAKRAKCDLIVIGTHGFTGPKHLLLGSTAERVVQHAPCSVLVVR